MPLGWSALLNWRGKPLLTSLTDEHFRGMAKPLEATHRSVRHRHGDGVAAFCAGVDTQWYTALAKGGALNKRG